MKYFKQIVICIGISIINLCIAGYSYAVEGVPDSVKIGIYYNSPELKVNKAVDMINLRARSGMDIILKTSNTEDIMIGTENDGEISVYKDHGDKSNSTSNVALSTYHISIGEIFPSYQSAKKYANDLKSSGVIAYPSYFEKTWRVWEGEYKEIKDANTAVDALTKNLSLLSIQVVMPMMDATIIKESGKILILTVGKDIVYKFSARNTPEQENKMTIVRGGTAKEYRGDIIIERLDNSDMTVTNSVSLDEYLFSVVPLEIGGNVNAEAMKAQAVVARTYAINSLGKHKKLNFDLCETTHCQVYSGFGSETKNSIEAVSKTSGEIVKYLGKLAAVFYFGSSGGSTENVQNVWGSKIPYLISVDDKYESKNSLNYNWEKEISASKLKEMMVNKGYSIGNILDMVVTERSTTNRVTALKFFGSNGEKLFLREACRMIIGGYSQLFDIKTDADMTLFNGKSKSIGRLSSVKVMTSAGLNEVKKVEMVSIASGNSGNSKVPLIPSKYIISGRGYGHAVGMSQEGAIGMGSEGYSYVEILKHYFPGTTVEK